MTYPLPPNYSQVKDPHGDLWSDIDHDPQILNAWKRVYYAMTSSVDPCQMANLADDPVHRQLLSRMRERVRTKMASIGDTFENSLHYRENWVSDDRMILRTAALSDATR